MKRSTLMVDGTGRMFGTVFLATAVVGAVLGGAISYVTADGTQAAPSSTGIAAVVASPSPYVDIAAPSAAAGDVAASVIDAPQGVAVAPATALTPRADEPVASGTQPATSGDAAVGGSATSGADHPGAPGTTPAPVPVASTQNPASDPATATPAPSATAQASAPAATTSPSPAPKPLPPDSGR